MSDKIGGVKRFTYEWRWEWEFEPVQHMGEIRYTDRIPGGTNTTTSSSSNGPVGASYLISTGSPFVALSYREERADSSPACQNPPSSYTHTCLDTSIYPSLPYLTGTYTCYRRLYRLYHAGGEGAITMDNAGQNSEIGSGNSATLLQSIQAADWSVIITAPPLSKTKPGYFIKRLGDRFVFLCKHTIT